MEIERRGEFSTEKSPPQRIRRRRIEVRAPRVTFMNARLALQPIERLRCGEWPEMSRLRCVWQCR